MYQFAKFFTFSLKFYLILFQFCLPTLLFLYIVSPTFLWTLFFSLQAQIIAFFLSHIIPWKAYRIWFFRFVCLGVFNFTNSWSNLPRVQDVDWRLQNRIHRRCHISLGPIGLETFYFGNKRCTQPTHSDGNGALLDLKVF